MKKSIITLAVLGAAVALPQVTMADVKVYGQAQVEVASYSRDEADVVGSGVTDGIAVEDNARGRIGIVATEDLGDNLKGLAKFEFKANTANGDAGGGASLTKRENFVGLKGSWGQLELGRLKSEYKYNGGVKYDPFVATSLEARGKGGMSKPKGSTGANLGYLGTNSFLSESVGYRVKAGPVKLGITYDPSEDSGLMSAAANFQTKKWEAFVAIIDAGDSLGTTAGDDEYSAVKFGGKFKFGNSTITGQYELTSPDTLGSTGTVPEPTFLFLGYQLKMGKNILVAQYGLNDADTTTGEGDIDYISLGVIHKFSKTTRVFGGFRSSSPDTGTGPSEDETVISVGLRKDFK